MNTDQSYSVSTRSSEQSLALGKKIAARLPLRLGDVVEFVGDLGGGKTTLIKGIAAGLGITQTVTSPTYNIQRTYQLPGKGRLEHYDLYRLSDDEILLDEMREIIVAGDAIICVEWADHFEQHLVNDRFVVEVHFINENERTITIKATGPDSAQRLANLTNLEPTT